MNLKIAAVLALATTCLLHLPVNAYDPDDVNQLLSTNRCTECDLSFAELQYSNLQYAEMWGSNLQQADLRGANLEGVDFRGADLRYADLRGANWQDANFERADLTGVLWN